jgi:LAO/AO transport system kinase
VASSGDGVADLWEAVGQHRAYLEESGELGQRREKRLADELREIILHRLEEQAKARCSGPAYEELQQALHDRRVDPYDAADQLLGTADD